MLQHTRNSKGQIASSSLSGAGVSSPITTTYAYDPAFGELSAITVQRGASTLFSYTVEQRDNLGREKVRREKTASAETRRTFEYDAAGRLSKVSSCSLNVDPSCLSPAEESFAFDTNGNFKLTPQASFDDQDRQIGNGEGSTFVHNAEGWRTRASYEFPLDATFHPAGHLLRHGGPLGSASYKVDPLGRRIERTWTPSGQASQVTHRWLYRDSLRPAAELDATNTLRSRFVYASGRNVPDLAPPPSAALTSVPLQPRSQDALLLERGCWPSRPSDTTQNRAPLALAAPLLASSTRFRPG